MIKVLVNKTRMNKYGTISFGSDPELFFKKDGKVISSDKIIPKTGFNSTEEYELRSKKIPYADHYKVIRDGVQLELNPISATCRQSHAYNIASCFHRLKLELEKKENEGISISFDEFVKIDKKDFENMSPECKMFGCMPSFNVYLKGDKISKIKADPAKYLGRGAGGHIHIGLNPYGYIKSKEIDNLFDKREDIVKVLDIVLGNTCVLLDRNPFMKERRKNYGRAGEYRLPKYGLEYRTLSNFWLKHVFLESLVMSLARLSVMIVHNDRQSDLFSLVNQKDVIKAINNNDLVLAKKNFDAIKNYLHDIDNTGCCFSFNETNDILPEFEYFLEKGIQSFFDVTDKGILESWTTGNKTGRDYERIGILDVPFFNYYKKFGQVNCGGFETFLDKVVRARIKSEKKSK